MTLIDVADAKEQLNLTSTDEDTELQRYVDAAIERIEDYTGQTTTAESFTETLRPVNSDTIILRHRPVTDVTAVESADGSTTWSVDDIDVEDDGFLHREGGAPFSGRITVTYNAGFATPPAKYELAALIIVQHLWQTQRGSRRNAPEPMSDSMSNTAGGGRGYAIPNAALELLGEPAPVVA